MSLPMYQGHQTPSAQFRQSLMLATGDALTRNDPLESNVTPSISRSSDFCLVLPKSKWGWLGMHCGRPGDYYCLSLNRILFHPWKVTPLANPAEVTDQRLCYCNSNAWGWHNSHQSGIIGITDQPTFQKGKKLWGVQKNNNGPKSLPCCTPETTFTSFLRQPSTITCCDGLDRNCANIYNTEPLLPTEWTTPIEWTTLNDPIKGCTDWPYQRFYHIIYNLNCSRFGKYYRR